MIIDNADFFAKDECFLHLDNEEKWISFTKNLHYLKKEQSNFATAIHKTKADKCLVANKQDKGYAQEGKLNKDKIIF